MGVLAWVDGMEALDRLRTRPLEDSAPLIEDPVQLRERASRDGFLFFRRLLPEAVVLPLRHCVLEYASRIDWLHPCAAMSEARAAPGKRIGYYQDPDWVNLQVHAQNRPEMWALGDAVAIHRALHALESRSSYLCLSTANTCRVFSPHPDMATQPHQDAHYVQMIAEFWTAWIPLGDCPPQLGPLALLAGSHLDGLREHSGQGIVDGGVPVPDDAVWSTTYFRCGDVVLFRPLTLHCSLPNRSGDRLRLSADFRYGFWSEPAGVDWRASSIHR
jgi:ectoine hydroxylase-related dioxygenase (phytanoyl-CoA dioxygenase family)